MKRNLLNVMGLAICISLFLPARAQRVIVTDNASYSAGESSSVLDVYSTNKGFIIPRLDQTARNAISQPANGLLIYQTDGTQGLYYNAGTPVAPNWLLVGNNAGYWQVNGSNIYYLSGNVGIGSSSTPAKLSILGASNAPSIPGGSSTGVLRIGVATSQGVDIGKLSTDPYSGWIQSGFGGTVADPLVLQPMGGKLGVGTSNPSAKLHVHETGSGLGVLFTGAVQTTPGNPPASGSGTRTMWYPDKAAFRTGYVSGTHWDKDSIGKYSFAAGWDVKAKGEMSIAMGYQTEATATSSYAYGNGCAAKGPFSFAYGLSATSLGNYSFAFGYQASSEGSFSTAIGGEIEARSGYEVAIGRYNIVRPVYSEMGWSTDDPILVVGNGTSDTERSNAITVMKDGCLGLQTMNYPFYALQLPNNSSNTIGRAMAYAWETYSDNRIKSNVHEIEYGIDQVMMLNPVSYIHHNSVVIDQKHIPETNGIEDVGFIAQELYLVIPQAVSMPENESNDLWGVSYDKLVPVLTKAIQEQQAMIDGLQRKIGELEKRIEE